MYADLKKVREFIKTEMLTIAFEEGKEIDVFGQSGFDFLSECFEGYIHPADYAEIVTTMNWLSN